jgi:TRAP-type uncharacterized transport system fused permease subunit
LNIITNQKNMRSITLKIIAILWVVFQFYITFFIGIPTIVARSVHVAFATSIVYLTKPLTKADKKLTFILDIACSIFYMVAAVYLLNNGERYLSRMAYIDEVFLLDIIIGIIFIILLIEACRRTLGLSMTIIVLVFCFWYNENRAFRNLKNPA